jgi:hypothetical protein
MFFDITDSPMSNYARNFKPMEPIGSFTISRTAAWHDRESLGGNAMALWCAFRTQVGHRVRSEKCRHWRTTVR